MALLPLSVLAPEAKQFPIKIPNLVAAPKWTLEPGDEFMALWGSGYDRARAFIEIEHRGKLLQSFWTEAGRHPAAGQAGGDRGHAGRLHAPRDDGPREPRLSRIPPGRRALDQQEPDAEMGAFRLQAGTGAERDLDRRDHAGPDAKKAVAEMVAALYDQSLDAYLPHNWQSGFGVFRQDRSRMNEQFENMGMYLNQIQGGWPYDQRNVQITYRSLPSSITADLWGYGYFGKAGKAAVERGGGRMPGAAGAPWPRAAPAMDEVSKFDAARRAGRATCRSDGRLAAERTGDAESAMQQMEKQAAGSDKAGEGRRQAGPDRAPT